MSASVFAVTATDPNKDKQPTSVQTLLQTLTVEEFIKLTPSDVRKKTGTKLSMKEAFAMKMMQKKLKKEIKGTEKTKGGEKKQLIAFILCWLLGGLGVHRFYTGHIAVGVVQLLTGGGCGIWWLIDFIRILIGNFKTKSGEELTPW